ncbi:cytochrome P450 [Leucogyrophana mollusca]|uniref:Cytochrome P450 n=1 Tax=Leucogyrophana mollusca TaxID=85980 RepID=A0ACB8B3A4_9AGAM|nr:cytochrome P450 [Leucogyrophana mollusca]
MIGSVGTSAILAITFGAVVASALVRKYYRSTATLRLPPGPPRLPIVGNALDIKPDEPWITYTQWGEIYGDLMYTRILNLDIIIINSEDMAKSLLEKRSNNYSDRPLVSINELFGLSAISALLEYGDTWRLHRKILHQAFRPIKVATYLPTQLQKARELLINLHNSPTDFQAHFQLFSASIIMSVMYGYTTAPREDPVVKVVKRAADALTRAVPPESAALLMSYPALKLIPAWFPGASFKREALLCRKYVAEMVEVPFKYVLDKMAMDGAVPCVVSDALSAGDAIDANHLEAIKCTSATAFVAGAETVTSALANFVLSMILYPHAQRRAQAEIDDVVGTNRLPGPDDRNSLPYVEAVMRETLRWHPVLPLGVAHAATNDDIFEGYTIPKGTTVVVNSWAISRDEARFPNASEFKPERWLAADGTLIDDTPDFCFGFGRRFCPGKPLTEATMRSGIASMLAIFDFSKSEDFEPKWTFAATSHPIPFPCQITPRSPSLSSEKLTQLIRISA